MKSIKFLHAHNHGHKNVGDDAMARNVFQKLSNLSSSVWTITTYTPPKPDCASKDVRSISGIVNDFKNPAIKLLIVVAAKFKLPLLYATYCFLFCELILIVARIKKAAFPLLAFGNLRNTLSVMEDTEVYIRSGSGSLNDIWFWSSMYPQYTEARIIKLYGGRVLFLGQGLGPITTPYRLKILRSFVNACDKIYLRDPDESRRLLASVSADVGKWEAVGDDAIDYPKEPIPAPIKAQLDEKPYIVCQFRPTDYEINLGDAYWSSLSKYLGCIRQNYPEVNLFAISFSTGRVNDLDAARRVNTFAGEELLHIIEHDFTPGEAKSVLLGAQVSIGQSYHFGVFSLAENTPFIGIYSNDYYKDKLGGLLDWYSLGNLLLRSDNVVNLPAIIEWTIRNRGSIEAEIASINQVLFDNVNSIYKELRQCTRRLQ